MSDNDLSSQASKPVKWIGYESIRTEHATNLVVQQHGNEFILYFFEVQLPFTTGSPSEQLAQLEEISHIEAKCVAKVVMSIPNGLDAGKVLMEQLGNVYKSMNNIKEGKRDANDM